MDRMGRIFTPIPTPAFAGAGSSPNEGEGVVLDGV